ncbi:MAG TPA: type II toxin-antitoxin system VapC family toxin [Rubrivivax sp.]|nr:type II toxin-antitoxin system VapC family toxin [Rubrivivax sp.]
MKPRIYVETSVISYLAARPSRDALVNFRQTLTHLWWEQAIRSCELFASGLVLVEIGRGDPAASSRRRSFCEELAMLEGHADSPALARQLTDAGLVPATEPEDALHIAEATLARMDYVATWNFAHFVNVSAKYKLVQALAAWGFAPPLFATPEELLESNTGVDS